MTLNERLKYLRLKYNKTQAELAEYLEITRQGYGYYESGKRNVDNETLNKLVAFYNVSSDYLLGLSDDDSTIEASQKTVIDLKELLMKEEIIFNGEKLNEKEKDRILGYIEAIRDTLKNK